MPLQHFDTVLAFVVVILILSLVITTLVQIVVVALGIRASNLLWGVRRLLERIPDLKSHELAIATKALSHPAVTATGKAARAIGSAELLAVLQDLANDGSDLPDAAKKALRAAVARAGPAEFRSNVDQLTAEFKRLFPGEAAKLDDALNLAAAKATGLAADIGTWFDTVMNRTTDRFVVYTRWVTVAFAILLALGLQIDSVHVLRQLSSNAELRASLVQVADQTLARADEVLLARSVALETLDSMKSLFDTLATTTIPATLATRGQGLAWLRTTFAGHGDLEPMVEDYVARFDALTRIRLESLGNQVLELGDRLDQAGLPLFPANWQAWKDSWADLADHILGVILTIVLLSLGAPFWFNALRTLSALRPVLAGRADPSKD